jgi:structural maintenance of chromosome 3 (chondroitin sulfate proteoglycan 6)
LVGCADQKRTKIDGVLETINERLNELEGEKEELQQVQVQDRQRRTLEYSFHQHELKEVGEALDQIEEDRRADIDQANTRQNEFRQRDQELKQLDQDLDNKKQELELLEIDHRQTSAERRDQVQAKAQVECLIRDAEDATRRGQDRLTRLQEQLQQVEEEINDKEGELMEAAPAWEDKVAEQSALQSTLDQAETTLKSLYAKQGRQNQFNTKRERDEHLTEQIDELKQHIQRRREHATQLEEDISQARVEVDDLAERQTELRGELDGRKEDVKRLSSEVAELKERQHTAQEKRK